MNDADRPTMDECFASAKAALVEGYVIMMTAPLDEAARLAMRPGSDSFEAVRARIAERRRARGLDAD